MPREGNTDGSVSGVTTSTKDETMKKILVSSLLSLASFTVLGFTLTVDNYANKYSVLKIGTFCTSSLGKEKGTTAPGEESKNTLALFEIQAFFMDHKENCKIELYNTDDTSGQACDNPESENYGSITLDTTAVGQAGKTLFSNQDGTFTITTDAGNNSAKLVVNQK